MAHGSLCVPKTGCKHWYSNEGMLALPQYTTLSLQLPERASLSDLDVRRVHKASSRFEHWYLLRLDEHASRFALPFSIELVTAT